MNVFKPTYHDQKGNLRKTAKWYVEFFDHRDKRHRIAAFTSKPATEEFGRTLEKLVCYHKASGGQIDPALHGWLTQLPRSIQERLFEYGLIDGRRAGCEPAAHRGSGAIRSCPEGQRHDGQARRVAEIPDHTAAQEVWLPALGRYRRHQADHHARSDAPGPRGQG